MMIKVKTKKKLNLPLRFFVKEKNASIIINPKYVGLDNVKNGQ